MSKPNLGRGISRTALIGIVVVVVVVIAIGAYFAYVSLHKPPTKPQVLVVYGPWGVNTPEGQAFLSLVSSFEKEYHVKVEYVGTTDYTTEAQEIESGSPPFDVVINAEVSLLRQLAAGGYLVDLTPYLESSGLLSQLIPYYVNYLNVSGAVYGVPVDAWTKPGIYVWVPTFERYNIPSPQSISTRWNWTQFMNYASDLKSHGVIPLGSGAADEWPLVIVYEPIVYSIGGKDLYYAIMCHKISYTSPIVEQTFEFYLALIAKGYFGTPAFAASQHFTDVYPLMENGTVAMYFMGDWTPFFLHNYTAVQPIMAPYINPTLANQYFVVSSGDWAVVPKDAPHNKTLAIEFVLWLASKDFQEKVLEIGWRAISPNRAAMEAAVSGQITVPPASKVVEEWVLQFSNNLLPDIADNMPSQFEYNVFWPTLAKMISNPSGWLNDLAYMEQEANLIYNQTNWDNTYYLCQNVTYTGPYVYTGPMYGVPQLLQSSGIPLPSWQTSQSS